MMKKEIQEDTRINIVSMAILPEVIYKIQYSLHQNTSDILRTRKKKFLKFMWNNKRPRIGKAILSEKE